MHQSTTLPSSLYFQRSKLSFGQKHLCQDNGNHKIPSFKFNRDTEVDIWRGDKGTIFLNEETCEAKMDMTFDAVHPIWWNSKKHGSLVWRAFTVIWQVGSCWFILWCIHGNHQVTAYGFRYWSEPEHWIYSRPSDLSNRPQLIGSDASQRRSERCIVSWHQRATLDQRRFSGMRTIVSTLVSVFPDKNLTKALWDESDAILTSVSADSPVPTKGLIDLKLYVGTDRR